MPITLNQLLGLQLSYGLVGMAFNIVSWAVVKQGGVALTTTPPLIGMAAMFLFCLCLIAGYRRHMVAYRTLMGIAILALGVGGILVHLVNMSYRPEAYSSVIAWALAVLINVFGLLLNLIAANGKFVDRRAIPLG